MRTVIVVFGNAGHGKDTFANMIKQVFDDHYIDCGTFLCERMAFADPVKQVGYHLVGIPTEISYGSQEDKATYKQYAKTARQWLQWIGTELGRDMIHKDVWVHRMGDRIKNHPANVIVISDGRFENERTELQEYLGEEYRVLNVRIIRPDIKVNLEHPSESEVYNMTEDLFDYVIHNQGTLEELEVEAQGIVNEVLDCHGYFEIPTIEEVVNDYDQSLGAE